MYHSETDGQPLNNKFYDMLLEKSVELTFFTAVLYVSGTQPFTNL